MLKLGALRDRRFSLGKNLRPFGKGVFQHLLSIFFGQAAQVVVKKVNLDEFASRFVDVLAVFFKQIHDQPSLNLIIGTNLKKLRRFFQWDR